MWLTAIIAGDCEGDSPTTPGVEDCAEAGADAESAGFELFLAHPGKSARASARPSALEMDGTYLKDSSFALCRRTPNLSP